jgi:5'-nucleotidase
MKRIYLTLCILCVAAVAAAQDMLTILHTNDTHSCIEPEKGGNGGVLNRALLLEHLRDSLGKENVLLFDCGDFSQGSLYYNTFKGNTEIELMNAMGYDACTIGNHEFDFGLENMARIFKLAEFPVVCANYDFTGTACDGVVKTWAVIERAGVRVGVFGLSPDPEGLVARDYYKGVKFISPVEAANRAVAALRKEGCDVIVCLSHLGWKIENEFNDERLARETSGIDVILGGHSHDYFEKPLVYTNAEGKEVIMQQMGKNGRYIGRVALTFE